MSRIRTLFSVVLPSMIAGGLVFGSSAGYAAAGDGALLGWWPAVGQAGAPTAAKPASPPAPIKPIKPPTPPGPPKAPKAGGSGFSMSFDQGGLQINGLSDFITPQLDGARAQLNNPSIPKDVRDKLNKRLDKVRAVLDKRLKNVSITDLEKFGEEMEKMGEEIEEAMEGLDKDLSKFGDKLGKDLSKQLGKLRTFKHDDDDDDDVFTMSPGVDLDDDDDDLRDAISDLKDLALKPAQRTAISKLRTDSDKTVAAAKVQLDALSGKLQTALGQATTTDAEISRYVDQISAQEAAIRKARILAWAQARRVLDDGQRKKVEAASKKKSK